MIFETQTEPAAVLTVLPERVDEFNAMHPDRRCHFTVLPAEEEQIRLRIWDGVSEGDSLTFAGTLSPGETGCRIIGEITRSAPGEGRLYGFFIAALARLTVLLLLYGTVLGISFLVGGRSFLLPLIAPAVIAAGMTGRAVSVRHGLPGRVRGFFCDYLGCTDRTE